MLKVLFLAALISANTPTSPDFSFKSMQMEPEAISRHAQEPEKTHEVPVDLEEYILDVYRIQVYNESMNLVLTDSYQFIYTSVQEAGLFPKRMKTSDLYINSDKLIAIKVSVGRVVKTKEEAVHYIEKPYIMIVNQMQSRTSSSAKPSGD